MLPLMMYIQKKIPWLEYGKVVLVLLKDLPVLIHQVLITFSKGTQHFIVKTLLKQGKGHQNLRLLNNLIINFYWLYT
jgi:hypothetical protein